MMMMMVMKMVVMMMMRMERPTAITTEITIIMDGNDDNGKRANDNYFSKSRKATKYPTKLLLTFTQMWWIGRIRL